MINKLTIEDNWRQNPDKIYYVIQNPRIDKTVGKVVGLTNKYVKYKVKDWDKEIVNFEKLDLNDNKRFPDILVFDKRYPDAEDEVFAEKISKTKKIKKEEIIYSYAIFHESKMAKYHKLIRLHRLAEQMAGIYKALQQKTMVVTDETDAVTEIKKGIDANKVDLTLDQVKSYFNAIQDTNYFEELESIQVEYPDLAVK